MHKNVQNAGGFKKYGDSYRKFIDFASDEGLKKKVYGKTSSLVERAV
jgi:hypothetical protein